MGISLVEVANAKVSIVTVCRMLGVDLPDEVDAERSRKISCPFGELYHSDQGLSPAMRIYLETNSAYCFSCTWFYTPVSLAARAWDISRKEAAERLLDRIGYRPLDLAEQWQAVLDYEPELDKALLGEALKTYCRRTCKTWGYRQFNDDVRATLTRCLSLLDLVKTADDATRWLAACKVAMELALYGEEPILSKKHGV